VATLHGLLEGCTETCTEGRRFGAYFGDPRHLLDHRRLIVAGWNHGGPDCVGGSRRPCVRLGLLLQLGPRLRPLRRFSPRQFV